VETNLNYFNNEIFEENGHDNSHMASLITRSNIFGKLKPLELKPEGETFRVETLGCQLPGKNKNKRICQHFFNTLT
jgi:hypothetical protein